ncbi:MAG TPA: Calx-beta domain-containing protein [Gammaproteobacteria bacterium]|nr:Calx-beta domain-containing protein [Gammaproteobacteria bacterium]
MKPILCLILALCIPPALAAQKHLFTPAPAVTTKALAALRRVTDAPATRNAAVRTVRINPALFNAQPGAAFTLALGQDYRVVTEQVITHADGVVTYLGRIVSDHLPYAVVLTRATNGMVLGSVQTPTRIWQVRAADTKTSLLIHKPYHARNRPPGKDVALPAAYTGPRNLLPSAERKRDAETSDVTIDLLLVYSPAVARAHPGAELDAFLRNLVDGANQAYADSHTGVSFHLAKTLGMGFGDMPVEQTAQCIAGLDVATAADGVGGCDSQAVQAIHNLRALYRADEVAMIIKTTFPDESGGVAGYGFEGGIGGSGPDTAYAVASPHPFTTEGAADDTIPGRLLAHELGHTLGAGHLNPDSLGAFAYSHAHSFGNLKGTIMVYPDSVGLFSNPDINCGGAPCGNRTQEDNALTIRLIKDRVAAYSEQRPHVSSSLKGIKPGGSFKLSEMNVSNGLAGTIGKVTILENDQPLRVLAYRAPIGRDKLDDRDYQLPLNLTPGAAYAIQIMPVYAPELAFQAPVEVSFSPPQVQSLTLARAGQTQAVFTATVVPEGLDTSVKLTASGGAGDVATTAIATARPPSGNRPYAANVALTIGGLDCGTHYTTSISASNAAGASGELPAGGSFTTAACGGSNPVIGNVSAAATGPHSATLTVAGDPGGTSGARFAILYGPQTWHDGGDSGFMALNAAGTLTFTLSKLNCNTSYQYIVAALSATGDAATTPATFKTAPCRPGHFSISGDTAVNFTDSQATYLIKRSGGSDGRVTLQVAATGVTAVRNEQFLQTEGTLLFADGETEKTLAVPLLHNAIDEGQYDFTVTLADPTGGAVLGEDKSVKTVITCRGDAALPAAHDLSITIKPGKTYAGTLPGSGPGKLVYGIVRFASHGRERMTDPLTGTFQYTARGDYSGPDSIDYRVENAAGSAKGTVKITVASASPPPSGDVGSGGGSALGLLSLVLLAAIPGLRKACQSISREDSE